MSVVLEPPLTNSGVWHGGGVRAKEALAVGPRYMRGAAQSRWHRVRSGVRWSDDTVSWTLWCGQVVSRGSNRLTADRMADDLPVCGTCEGRACGAGQDDWPLEGPGLLFSPRRLTAPKHCPGSRKEAYEALSLSAGRCLVCGSVESVRAMGGPYNGRVAMIQHSPGAELVPGCPFHAWRELRIVDGSVVCGCRVEPIEESA